MKGIGLLLVIAAIAGSALLDGCSKQAATSSEAIEYSKTLRTPSQKSSYLLSQTQVFVDAKDYQEAIKTAQYVLSSVEVGSQAAADLMGQAKARLAADAQAVIGETKKLGERSTDAL